MGRSENIKGRVLRNLRNFMPSSNVTDEEIYDELTNAQNVIISEVNPSKTVQITLQEGQEYYKLSTYTGIIERKNIVKVRAVKLPASIKSFDIIPIYNFIQIVNSTNTITKNSFIGTIYNNELRIFPVPTSELNGEVLELIVYLSSSTKPIDKNNEPELPEMFDKALELFATSQFLAGDYRIQFLNEFAAELRRLRPLVHRTYQLERASIL